MSATKAFGVVKGSWALSVLLLVSMSCTMDSDGSRVVLPYYCWRFENRLFSLRKQHFNMQLHAFKAVSLYNRQCLSFLSICSQVGVSTLTFLVLRRCVRSESPHDSSYHFELSSWIICKVQVSSTSRLFKGFASITLQDCMWFSLWSLCAWFNHVFIFKSRPMSSK